MGLSSNVMNMKFMQKAQDRSKAEEEQAETKKVKDLSEWLLPSSAIRPKSKPSVTIRTVGYGSIASLTAKDNDEEQHEATPLLNPAVTKATVRYHFPYFILVLAKRSDVAFLMMLTFFSLSIQR